MSPGSRNAPLIKSYAIDSFFTTYSIIDERSAGFFALGIAQQTGNPVIVVCTSGSAVLNYHPAVAEAYYSNIPLIVISADRLPFKIDIGDGQVIRQAKVLEQHTIYSGTFRPDVMHGQKTILECPHQKIIPQGASESQIYSLQQQTNQFNYELAEEAFQRALKYNQPIHLNAPFAEPLYEMTDKIVELPESNPLKIPLKSSSMNLEKLIENWNQFRYRWILIGASNPNLLTQKVIDLLSRDPNTVVLTETTSNIYGKNFIYSIDSLMFPYELKTNIPPFQAPEVVLTIGGMIISKKIKSYLRNIHNLEHWHLGFNTANDTFYSLTEVIKCNPNEFLDSIYSVESYMKVQTNYGQDVLEKFNYFKGLGDEFLKKIPFSDLKAFSLISTSVPRNTLVHFSNSSIIRYAQLFQWDPSISIFCNRGVSGIEGSLSVALGASQITDNPTLLITGDLSLFYDSNGFWNKYIRSDFRIILINNRGGGIFRIIPTNSKDTPVFDQYVETVHNRNARYLAEEYGFDYMVVKSSESLNESLETFYQLSDRPRLLEIQTPRRINDMLLLDYFNVMAEKECKTKKYFSSSII